MSEESFEQLLDESIKIIHNGEVVEGTVIDVKDDQIVLNIGYKSDGIITKHEYSSDPSVVLSEVVKPGDKMDVKVLKVNDGDGQVLLSYRRIAADRGNKKLEEAFNNHEVLTAPVVQALNGGLSVKVEGSRVFIPASLVSDVFERDLKKFEGQEISFVLIEFDPAKRRIIGDRKQLIIAEKERAQEELLSRISIGDTVEGTVKNVTDFGAFIDLNGADGLLHISEMSWGRVDNPRQVLSVGEKISVLIKDISDSDKGKKKIALSLKFEDRNPWLSAAEKYAAGNVVEGRIARMTDFGAFVELEPGVDALLHVSQISRERVEKPSDVLSVGQIVNVKVVDFNEDSRRISLSMKALEPRNPVINEDLSESENKADAAEEAQAENSDEADPEVSDAAEEAPAQEPEIFEAADEPGKTGEEIQTEEDSADVSESEESPSKVPEESVSEEISQEDNFKPEED